PVGELARADGRLLGSGLVHRVAGHPLLEIEAPVDDEPQAAVPVQWLDALFADGPRIPEPEEASLVASLAAAAGRIRAFPGFDRVSVHRFTHGGNVELVTESCAPSVPGLAGRIFTADHLPGLWGRVFGLQWLRAIADVDAEPVPVELPPALAAEPMALSRVS